MANEKQVSGTGLEWRVTVPEGSSVKVESESASVFGRARLAALGLVTAMKSGVLGFGKMVWNLGVDDPRKVMHGVKVGIALALVSLFYYTRPLYDGVGGAAMWAVMTVVVVFEFTIGGCLYKGTNRAMATFSGGGLAIGAHWVASKAGDPAEPVILSTSVFILASAATFSRFIPKVKKWCDYGITIFILTFSLVAVSGYRVDKLVDLAQQRLSTIAIGISICMLVCFAVCPVWAGTDLHRLIARNMDKLADSMEGCVEEYFNKDEAVDGKNTQSAKSQGYKCVLNSKASEDSLGNLARWEPAHGRFGFRHPWHQYLKIGAAMRNCAYCIESLSGCINSEIQAPESIKKHLCDVCMRLSMECSKVLKESANSIDAMRRSRTLDFIVGEMNVALQELHSAFKSLPNHSSVQSPLTEALPVITVASLLIEITSRTEAVVDAVEKLADLARFKSADDDKHKKSKQDSNSTEDQELQL